MPPCPWTIGLGKPGRAGGEQRPQRMIEGHLLVVELASRIRRAVRRACASARAESAPAAGVVRVQVRQVDEVLERGQVRQRCGAARRGGRRTCRRSDSRRRRRAASDRGGARRSSVPRSPKSGEQHAQIAPMAVVSPASRSWSRGMLGIQATTRSPGLTPSARSSVASVRTRLPSVSHLSGGQRARLAHVQEHVPARRARAAARAARSSGVRPGNHSAPGMLRRPSTRGTAPRPRCRSNPRAPARSPPGPRPTSATAPRSPRNAGPAPVRASRRSAVTLAWRIRSGPGVHRRSPGCMSRLRS